MLHQQKTQYAAHAHARTRACAWPQILARTLAVLCLGMAAALSFIVFHFYTAANPNPSSSSTRNATDRVFSETSTQSVTASESAAKVSPYPDVDWTYWQNANPDIIGWITVPDTSINHPIVQAQPSAPDFYLTHDVCGDYNPLGAVYLDAECAAQGLLAQNAVILGHHWEGPITGCFTTIASYGDKTFAQEHKTILIQTPTSQMEYEVRFVNIVPGWEPLKRTSFADSEDFNTWYKASLTSAAVTLDASTHPAQTISLVSCSYNYWRANERTVVVASKQNSSGNMQGGNSLSSNVREE